jgi:MFS family permease
MPAQPLYRRNLVAVTTASFIGFTGFTLVMPFLPLYIGQLGVRDIGETAMWAGLSLGVTPAITAALSPIWGRIADRFGRKLLVERSLLSCIVIMTAMAYATRPWQVFALRAVQGLFAGYGALTVAMAAESAPRDRMASAIGMVQTAQRLGPAFGPVIGGMLAAVVGLRYTFFVTSGVYAVAFLLVLVLYRERAASNDPGEQEAAERVPVAQILRSENFLLVLAVIFGIQFVDRSFGPILPLYVKSLDVAPSGVALVSGSLFSVAALASALGHHFCSRLLKRFNLRLVLVGGASLAAAALLVFMFARHLPLLGASLGLFGFGVGVTMTAAYAAGGAATPQRARATGFGFLSASSLSALAISPVVSGLLMATGIRTVFIVDLAGLGILVLVARNVTTGSRTRAATAWTAADE